MGPLHTSDQRKEVEEQVADAVKRGGKVLFGAERPKGGDYDEAITCCRRSWRMDRVAALERGSLRAGLPSSGSRTGRRHRRANGSMFGLGSSVWTRDINKAMHAAEEIEAGYTWINSAQIIYDELPFGGVKQSGLGKEHGEEAIEHYTESKSVVIATETQSEAIGGE
jgi:succinate-semialdehyde dehydrogenase/glutarate-semialdehyde dehydrogenase